MGITVAIHANPAITHQIETAEFVRLGFAQHGIEANVTHSPNTVGDVHVVNGPHFALRQWRHSNTLLIDRAYWDDPNSVSVHWLRNGEKFRATNTSNAKALPELKPYKSGSRVIYLCDYGETPEGRYDVVRRHPAYGDNDPPLLEALAQFDIAIGKRTTALVDAAIAGLTVITDDPHSPVAAISNRSGSRTQWLRDLAAHNWTKQELANGAFLYDLGNRHSPDEASRIVGRR